MICAQSTSSNSCFWYVHPTFFPFDLSYEGPAAQKQRGDAAPQSAQAAEPMSQAVVEAVKVVTPGSMRRKQSSSASLGQEARLLIVSTGGLVLYDCTKGSARQRSSSKHAIARWELVHVQGRVNEYGLN
jgi:hypothetical protein